MQNHVFRRQFAVLAFIAVTITVLSGFATAGDGPGSGGGGGTDIQFFKNQCPMLIDLLTTNPELAKRSDLVVGRDCAAPEVKTNPEFEALRPEDLLVLEKAKALLARQSVLFANAQARLPLALSMRMSLALNDMTFVRTSHEFELIHRFDLNPKLAQTKFVARTVMLHLPRYGVLISDPAWDSETNDTKVALLVHESLRQIQNGFWAIDLSEKALQTIVANLLLPNPSVHDLEVSLLSSEQIGVRCIATAQRFPKDLRELIDPRTSLLLPAATVESDALSSFLNTIDTLGAQGMGRNLRSEMLDATPERRQEIVRELVQTRVFKP